MPPAAVLRRWLKRSSPKQQLLVPHVAQRSFPTTFIPCPSASDIVLSKPVKRTGCDPTSDRNAAHAAQPDSHGTPRKVVLRTEDTAAGLARCRSEIHLIGEHPMNETTTAN